MATRTVSKRNSRTKSGSNLAGMALLGISIVSAAVILSRQSGKVEAQGTHNAIVAEFDTISVPVPASAVPAGMRLKDVRFKNVAFPRQQVPAGAVTDISSFSEATAVTALPANLPLFKENLSLTGAVTNPVVERIPAGMRAMTIKVDATSSVEGWAGSGSVVDVLLVQKDRTTVIAENVKILSAERSVSPVEGQAAPSVPSTVTLLVSQEQCLAINTAIPLGKIAFALRSTKDSETWTSTTYTADNLKGGGISSEKKNTVTGFAVVKDDSENTTFALSGDKWVKTDVVPEGFFAAGSESHAKN